MAKRGQLFILRGRFAGRAVYQDTQVDEHICLILSELKNWVCSQLPGKFGKSPLCEEAKINL